VGAGLVTSREAGWSLVNRPPHPALRAHVLGYSGYREESTRPNVQRELPSSQVVLIIGFGAPLRILGDPFVSFVAGFGDVHTLTEYAGGQRGIQVDLTPLGAYSLFAVPMSELTNRVVHLDDLLGADAQRLVDMLASAPGWPERFALLDDVLLGRLAAGPVPSPEVRRAWALLRAGATVAATAADVGWSRRHLAARFRQQVGLAPKPAAQVLRFERAVRLLSAPGGPRLAETAVTCGYFDQAHLNREFRRLAGCTPTAWQAEVAFVQSATAL
jgi:AraC-like DNA-binding protein